MNASTPLRPLAHARNLATILALLGLLFPFAPLAVAQAAANATQPSRELLSTLSELLDTASIDVDELALDLAFEDPQAIGAWVSDGIDYQVYRGLLRGPRGTLVAKAGNALDQSVLLATLLGDAGYDARIALGTLSDADATRLLVSMFEPGQSLGPTFDVEALTAALGPEAQALEEAYGKLASTPLSETDVYREAAAETDRLLQTLGSRPDQVVTDDLLTEAREYAWVEYRLGPAEQWQATHPAFASAADAPNVGADEYLTGEVPAELTHRLRIEVSIERKRGDEFQIEPIMAPWERPVANLVGVPIEIGNTVMGDVSVGNVEEMRSAMAEAAFFAPVLDGALAPGAQAFDLHGNLVPPDAAASQMAEFFQSVGGAMGGAIGALGAMGSDEEPEVPFALTAQYVDFVVVAPGGAEQRFRRTIFDRRDPAGRAEDTSQLLPEASVLDSVLTMQTVMVSVGAMSTDFVMAGMIEQSEAQLDVMDRLAALDVGDTELDRGAALLEAAAGLSTRDHLQLFAAFDAFELEGSPLVYRAEPTVVALFGTLALSDGGSSTSGVDIIANARRALRLAGEVVVGDFPAAVFAGVWDTLMEREFLASRTIDLVDSVPAPGTLATFDDYATLVHSGAAVPATAATALQRDLAAGYSVVISVGAASAGQAWSYWRVDPVTGETLGIGTSGRGVSMTEFIANLQIGLIVSGFLSVPSFIGCASSGASWTCYCDVVTSGVLLPLGFAYLGALAGATGAIFTVLDIAVVGPITTLWTPPICSSLAIRDSDELKAVTAAGGCRAA